MDNPNITMEEYIRLEEEKTHRHGKVYNWETDTYGKIWYDEDVHDLRSVETEFLAITFNDKLTSEEALSCEPTVSPLNDNEIDFRISFDESDDEDYTVIFDKKLFSYKIISVDNLKTVSENDNDKVNMPSFPPPEPKVSYFDDLDFLKDFENEFPAIVYNDAIMSKSDFSTEPVEIPHRIDEFDLKTKTSLLERDEKEQNVLYFNDLFPFNIIYPDDLKLEKDNDDEIDIIQSSGGKLRRPRGLSDLMAEGLIGRMLMEHKDAQGQSVFTSRVWRQLFEIRGPLVHELILEFFSTFKFGEVVVDLDTTGALQFYLEEVRHRMSWRKFILALGLHITKEMEIDGFGLYWAESGRQISNKAPTPKRQPDVAAGAPKAAGDTPAVDEVARADPAPMQAPQPPHFAPRTMPQRITRLEEFYLNGDVIESCMYILSLRPCMRDSAALLVYYELCKYGHDQASKRSKSSCDGCWVPKSWITRVNTNGNTMLSEAQGVSLRITSDVRVRTVYHDLYFGEKALAGRENVGFDLARPFP
ncbi:hypothetical protein Tco_1106821 [Tanacetum coccineum]